MEDRLRKSIWAKSSAILMIYMIVCGNIWFTLLVVGQSTPEWLINASRLGAFGLLISACGFLTLLVGTRLGLISEISEPSSSPEKFGS